MLGMDSAACSPDGLPGRKEVLILVNSSAGSKSADGHVARLERTLRSQGLEAVLCRNVAELGAQLKERAGRLRCVIAAGGDGTLNAVLNHVAGAPVPVPVSVLPLGNENLVARHFGLTLSPTRLAEAVASGSPRVLDLGRAGERLFAVMAGFGFDARVIHDVHRNRLGHIGKLNYAGPIIRALWGYSYPLIEVRIEETGEQLSGATAFVFNLPEYALHLPICRRARGDDGWLDLVIFDKPGSLNLAGYLTAVLLGRHEARSDVRHRRVRRVTLRSAGEVPVQIDGEPAGFLPTTVEVVPGAWRMLAG